MKTPRRTSRISRTASGPSSRHRSAPVDDGYRRLFLDSTAGIIIVDDRGKIIEANAAAADIVGLSRAAIAQRSLHTLARPTAQKEIRSGFLAMIAGTTSGGTFTITLPRRGTRTIEYRLLAHSAPHRHALLLRDATEQHRISGDLAASEERYRSFIRNSSEGVWCFGLDRPVKTTLPVKTQITRFLNEGYLLECNDAYARMYGFSSAEEIAGIRLSDVLVASDPKNIAFLENFIRSGYRLQEHETVEQDRRGRQFTVMNNLVGTVVDGAIVNAWGTQRDVTEQKRSEEDLRTTRDAYADLINRIPFIVYKWRFTAAGKFHLDFISPQIKDLYGLDPDELRSNAELIFAMIHPDERTAFIALNLEHAKTLAPFFWEGRMMVNGTERWVRFDSSPERLPNGDVLWDGIIQDTTERRRAEQQLQSTGQLNSFLVEAAAAIGNIEREEDLYRYIGETMERLLPECVIVQSTLPEDRDDVTIVRSVTGLPPLLKKTLYTLFGFNPVGHAFRSEPGFREKHCHPELQRFPLGLYDLAPHNLTRGVAKKIETILKIDGIYAIGFSRGEERFGYLHLLSYRGFDTARLSVVEPFIHLCTTALQKLRSLKRISESEQRYRLLADHATDVVWIMDFNGTFKYISPSIQQLRGFTPEELMSLPVAQHVSPSSLPAVSAFFKKAQLAAAGVIIDPPGDLFEIEQPCKDGRTIWVEVNARVVYDDEHRPYGVLGVSHDITRRKQAEIENAQKRFESEFLADASMALSRCTTENEVFSTAAAMLCRFVPDGYLFTMKNEADNRHITLLEIVGIDPALLEKGRKILRFDPIGRSFEQNNKFQKEFRSPRLFEFPGGLYELSDGVVPEFAAKKLEKLLGASFYYSLGIAEEDSVYGYIHIFSPKKLSMLPSTAETFARQCHFVLSKVRSVRLIEDEVQRRRTLMTASGDGIAIFNASYRVVECNPRFASMIGYQPSEVVGMAVWEIDAVLSEPDIRRRFAEVPRVPVTMETKHRKKNGGTLDVEVTLSGTLVEGQPFIIISCRDISERSQMLEALKQSEESYHGLFDNVQVGIFIQNERGELLDVNSTGERFLGYERSELIGTLPQSFTAPGLNAHIDLTAIYADVLSGKHHQFEYVGRHKNGTDIPFDIHLFRGIYFGRPVVISVAQDISLRKALEQEREGRLKQLQGLFDLTQRLSLDIPPQEIYDRAAAALVEMIGCDRSSVLLFDEKNIMRFVASVGLSASYRAAASGHSPWSADAIDPDPIFVEDVTAEPTLERLRPTILGEGIRALGFIPLVHDRKLLGKFMVYCNAPHRFTEGEVKVAGTIAQVVSNAIARKRSAVALAENEQKLRNIFETMEEGLALNEAITDADGNIVDYRIVEVNPAFERVSGLPRDQVVGRLASDLYQMPKEYITAFWKEHIHDTNAVKTDLFSEQAKSWKHVSSSIPVNGKFVTSFFDITDLKNTELALRESERFNRQLHETSPYATVVAHPDGRIISANAQALVMYGYTAMDELNGHSILSRVADSDKATALQHLAVLHNGTMVRNLQLQLKRKDGSLFYGEVNGSIIPDDQGKPRYILVITADITERYLAEKEVRRSRKMLERGEAVARFGNWELSLDTRIMNASAGAKELYGFDKDRQGIPLSEVQSVVLPEYRSPMDRALQDLVRYGIPYEMEFKIRRKNDGAILDILSKAELSPKNNKIFGIIQDITARKKSEADLRQSEERYRNIVQNLHQAYYESDKLAVFTYVNPGLVLMSGHTEQELVGSISFRMVAKEDRPRVIAAYKQWMTEKQTSMTIEFRVNTKTGRNFWVEQTTHFEFDGKGDFVRATNFVKDITERIQSQRRLRDSEEQYRTLFESSHDGISLIDLSGRIIIANSSKAKIFRYDSAEALKGVDGRSLVHPASAHAGEEMMTLLLTDGSFANKEVRSLRRDGSEFIAEYSAVLVKDPNGVPLYIMDIVRDITERKRSELELQQSETRYRQITEAITDYIYTVSVSDRAAVKTNHGPGCIAITGYASGEFDADPYLWLTMIAPEDRDRVQAQVDLLFATGSSTPVEHRIIRKDGQQRWVRSTLVPRFNEAGALVSYDGLIQDVTERRTADEKLRASEERNSALIRTLPDIIFVHDRNGRFLDYHSPEGTDLAVPVDFIIGHSIEELLTTIEQTGIMLPGVSLFNTVTKRYEDIDHHLFVDRTLRPLMLEAVQTGNMQSYQYSLQWNGIRQYYDARLIAFDDDDKVLHIIRDVTDRVNAEQEVHLLNAELELRVLQRTTQLYEANRELEAFSYSVSHDLRAPLRAIDSFSAVILEGYQEKLDAEAVRLFGVIRSSIKKMDLLINGLLMLSKAGQGKLRLTPVNTDLLVREVLTEIGAGTSLAPYDIRIGTLPVITADEPLLRQVFSNLLSNAVKYSSAVDRPQVEITAESRATETLFTVRDNGAGFDPANVGKLFGIFQRLHTDDQFKGLGIGLSIVQRIVRKHGGRVSAEGMPNSGAAFSFTIPHTPRDL